MRRDVYLELLDWKKSRTRKPLILKGVRQVGKTYILKEFGKNEYGNVAYFNFEGDPNRADFFMGRIQPAKLIEQLSIYSEVPIRPRDTLIILDDIQNAPRALTALKYFCEDAAEYHVAAAGSLLGLKLGHASPFLVGKVNFLDLYPLTFGEYLDAVGRSKLREFLDNRHTFDPIENIFHEEALELLKMYFYIGGMPEVVNLYINDKDLQKVRQAQNDILFAYLQDFSKYSTKTEALRITDTWNAIPPQLAKKNKKFKYSEISKYARSRDYYESIQWLIDAGLVYGEKYKPPVLSRAAQMNFKQDGYVRNYPLYAVSFFPGKHN